MFTDHRWPGLHRPQIHAFRLLVIWLLVISFPVIGFAEPSPPPEPSPPGVGKDPSPPNPAVNGSINDANVLADLTDSPVASGGQSSAAEHGRPGDANTNSRPPSQPRYSNIWAPVSEFSGCGTSLGGGSWSCAPHPDSCEAGSGSQVAGTGDVLEIGNVSTAPVEGVTQRGMRVDNENPDAEPVDLGIRCALPGTPEYEEAPPVVIIVTREDFARLPVEPLQAHAGPAEGWLPVNMVNVLYTEPDTQLLNTELLDTPVAIRATPVSYHWDLGDGNTITTSNPGEPFPSETISSTYTQEGWYDITLTTTFSGQFSVAGGEWQDIDGTIEVSSDPVPVFSKSLESRLVDGDVPVDESEDPWIPERTSDTQGTQDPDARHREI